MSRKSSRHTGKERRSRSRTRSPHSRSKKETLDKHKRQHSHRHKRNHTPASSCSLPVPLPGQSRQSSRYSNRKPSIQSKHDLGSASPSSLLKDSKLLPRRHKQDDCLRFRDSGSLLCSSLLGFENAEKEEFTELSSYMTNRSELLRLAFASVTYDGLQQLLPLSLMDFNLDELFQLATEELEGLSKSRLEAVLEGRELSASSASSDSGDEVDFKEYSKNRLLKLLANSEKDSAAESTSAREDCDSVKSRPDSWVPNGRSTEEVQSKESIKTDVDAGDATEEGCLSLDDDYFDARSDSYLGNNGSSK